MCSALVPGGFTPNINLRFRLSEDEKQEVDLIYRENDLVFDEKRGTYKYKNDSSGSNSDLCDLASHLKWKDGNKEEEEMMEKWERENNSGNEIVNTIAHEIMDPYFQKARKCLQNNSGNESNSSVGSEIMDTFCQNIGDNSRLINNYGIMDPFCQNIGDNKSSIDDNCRLINNYGIIDPFFQNFKPSHKGLIVKNEGNDDWDKRWRHLTMDRKSFYVTTQKRLELNEKALINMGGLTMDRKSFKM